MTYFFHQTYLSAKFERYLFFLVLGVFNKKIQKQRMSKDMTIVSDDEVGLRKASGGYKNRNLGLRNIRDNTREK